jgi:hypothetical protein
MFDDHFVRWKKKLNELKMVKVFKMHTKEKSKEKFSYKRKNNENFSCFLCVKFRWKSLILCSMREYLTWLKWLHIQSVYRMVEHEREIKVGKSYNINNYCCFHFIFIGNEIFTRILLFFFFEPMNHVYNSFCKLFLRRL